jgi:hypothetical protein
MSTISEEEEDVLTGEPVSVACSDEKMELAKEWIRRQPRDGWRKLCNNGAIRRIDGHDGYHPCPICFAAGYKEKGMAGNFKALGQLTQQRAGCSGFGHLIVDAADSTGKNRVRAEKMRELRAVMLEHFNLPPDE